MCEKYLTHDYFLNKRKHAKLNTWIIEYLICIVSYWSANALELIFIFKASKRLRSINSTTDQRLHNQTSQQYCISTTFNFTAMGALHFCQSISWRNLRLEFNSPKFGIISSKKITKRKKNLKSVFLFRTHVWYRGYRICNLVHFFLKLSITYMMR